MKIIDYLIGKFKQLICFVSGHNLRPYYKYESLHPGVEPRLKIMYKCTRCGKKIIVAEYKNNQLTSR